jgi:hypothetical protein
MKNWIALVVALITAAGGIFQVWLPLRETQANSPGTLAEGQKICRAVIPNQFTDGIIVSKNWTIDNCATYASKVGATQYYLGCVWAGGDVEFTRPYTAAPQIEQGQRPARNCGW